MSTPEKKPEKKKTVRDSAFYARIGAKGGRATAAKHGPEFYARIGSVGGNTLLETLGQEHFIKAGRAAAQARAAAKVSHD